ncbi:MAG: hydrolase [Patescibacteria group bacterium]|nr:hydrolase [Patescibacteria group bacterium]
MNTPELITIVDQDDNVIGSQDRLTAYQSGNIIRLASVILFNSQGQILLQQRSARKQQAALKWSTSAAGHVDAGESYLQAIRRETQEELGLPELEFQPIGKYYSEIKEGHITFRHFKSVFRAHSDLPIIFDPVEVATVRWVSPAELNKWLAHRPDDFSSGIRETIRRFGARLLSSE